jgi:hypothetical protein
LNLSAPQRAFCLTCDCAVGLILPCADTAMMQLHLNQISAELPPQVYAAMITTLVEQKPEFYTLLLSHLKRKKTV